MARALPSQREIEELAGDGLIDQMDVGHGQAHIREDITIERNEVGDIHNEVLVSLSSRKGERLRPFLRERPQSVRRTHCTSLLSSGRSHFHFIVGRLVSRRRRRRCSQCVTGDRGGETDGPSLRGVSRSERVRQPLQLGLRQGEAYDSAFDLIKKETNRT